MSGCLAGVSEAGARSAHPERGEGSELLAEADSSPLKRFGMRVTGAVRSDKGLS